MSLSIADADRVARAYKVLSAKGPQLGRPVADRIQGSRIHNLEELRVSGEDGQNTEFYLYLTQYGRHFYSSVAINEGSGTNGTKDKFR